MDLQQAVELLDVVSHHLVTKWIVRPEGLRRQNYGFHKTDFAVSIFGTRELIEVFGKGG